MGNPEEKNFVPKNPEEQKIGFLIFPKLRGSKKAGELESLHVSELEIE